MLNAYHGPSIPQSEYGRRLQRVLFGRGERSYPLRIVSSLAAVYTACKPSTLTQPALKKAPISVVIAAAVKLEATVEEMVLDTCNEGIQQ